MAHHVDAANPNPLPREPLDFRPTVIGTSVINQNHLEAASSFSQDRFESVDQPDERRTAVEDWNNDRYSVRRLLELISRQLRGGNRAVRSLDLGAFVNHRSNSIQAGSKRQPSEPQFRPVDGQ